MSSGFVSGGTTDNPIQKDDEWLAAQQQIEHNRRLKEADAQLPGDKSLYEILQNNKAAKQEAFEESIKLKNQFRNLDEDEVEFLDSVLESTRAKEEAVKRETTEQLDAFRRQQEEADRALREGEQGKEVEEAGSPTALESNWAVGAKKRKRVKEKEGWRGVKLRKSSSSALDAPRRQEEARRNSQSSPPPTELKSTSPNYITGENKSNITVPISSQMGTSEVGSSSMPSKDPPSIEKPAAGLGLAGYSSGEDG
ncbi:MAG: hypothetical protein Q9163_004354 [Psora crenata]